MARLNEAAGAGAAQETIEALRRRYIRQNRDLAKTNSVLAQKIHGLEEHLAKLVGENHAMRAEMNGLAKRARLADRVMSRIGRVRQVLDQQLLAVQQAVAGLDQISGTEPHDAEDGVDLEDAEDDDRQDLGEDGEDGQFDQSHRDREREREAREARFEMFLDRMPTIDENSEFRTAFEDSRAQESDDDVEDEQNESEDELNGREDAQETEEDDVTARQVTFLDLSRPRRSAAGRIERVDEEAENDVGPPASRRRRTGRVSVYREVEDNVVEPAPAPAQDAIPVKKRKRTTGPDEDRSYGEEEYHTALDADDDLPDRTFTSRPADGANATGRKRRRAELARNSDTIQEAEKENSTGITASTSASTSLSAGPGPRRALSQKSVNGAEQSALVPAIIEESGKEVGRARRPSGGETTQPTEAELDHSRLLDDGDGDRPAPPRSRRARATINYAEPSLVKKLRRPDDSGTGMVAVRPSAGVTGRRRSTAV